MRRPNRRVVQVSAMGLAEIGSSVQSIVDQVSSALPSPLAQPVNVIGSDIASLAAGAPTLDGLARLLVRIDRGQAQGAGSATGSHSPPLIPKPAPPIAAANVLMARCSFYRQASARATLQQLCSGDRLPTWHGQHVHTCTCRFQLPYLTLATALKLHIAAAGHVLPVPDQAQPHRWYCGLLCGGAIRGQHQQQVNHSAHAWLV